MEIARLIIDFGFLILIWMVQVIMYPAMYSIKRKNFAKWHEKYSTLISYFVAPLLFIQTGLITYQLLFLFDILLIAELALLSIIWVTTFFVAIPLHNQMNLEHRRKFLIQKLIGVNWIRTACWSLLFICSTIRFFKDITF